MAHPRSDDALADYRAGRYADALAGARAWAAGEPTRAAAHRLLAQAAYRLREYAVAAAAFETAERLGGGAECAFNAGNAWQAHGDAPHAIEAWQRAWHARVSFAGTPLARALAQRGDADAAAHVFREIARRDGNNFDAVQAIVDLASAHRDEPSASIPMPPPGDLPRPREVSFVVCSIDAAKLAAFQAMIERRFAGIAHEVIAITDARSLGEGYQRGFAKSRGDAIVFCHDDIDILAEDAAERLLLHLTRHELVGVAGTTRVTGPAVLWSGHPWIHCWMTHRLPGESDYEVAISSLDVPVVTGVEALDGVFLACRRDVVERVGFDAVTFDGFHLYDLDFTYRAQQAGRKLAIVCDLALVHASKGRFDISWQRYADRFMEKFPDLSGARGTPHWYAVRVPSADDVLSLQRRLHRMLAV
jgi:tetratricopeptide (TPR) repeat protein